MIEKLIADLEELHHQVEFDILEPMQQSTRTSYEAILVVESYLRGIERSIQIARAIYKANE